MGLVDIWRTGHEIVVTALKLAETGKYCPKSKCHELDIVANELRLQLEKIPYQFRKEVNTSALAPWRACEYPYIGNGSHLECVCKSYVEMPGKIDWELIQRWKRNCEDWLLSLESSQTPLIDNDVAILDQMLRSQITADSPRTLAEILNVLNRKGGDKHACDNLKDLGYVGTKRGPNGGFYLTESGIERAKRLRSK